jgi:hypothetical protein
VGICFYNSADECFFAKCRTRKTSSSASSFSLAQKMLPRELLQQLRMEPRPKVKGQKRKRLPAVLEEEEEEG